MPYRAAKRGISSLAGRVGRRGAALITIGIIWLAYGLAGLTVGATVQPTLWASVPHFLFPVAWAVTGFVSVVVGFRHKRETDTLGFTSLSIMPTIYAAAFLVTGLVGVVPFLPAPLPAYYPEGIFWAVAWSAVVALIALLSSWPEIPESVEELRVRHPDEVLGEEDSDA